MLLRALWRCADLGNEVRKQDAFALVPAPYAPRDSQCGRVSFTGSRGRITVRYEFSLLRANSVAWLSACGSGSGRAVVGLVWPDLTTEAGVRIESGLGQAVARTGGPTSPTGVRQRRWRPVATLAAGGNAGGWWRRWRLVATPGVRVRHWGAPARHAGAPGGATGVCQCATGLRQGCVTRGAPLREMGGALWSDCDAVLAV